MGSPYKKLVESVGEDAARQSMRELRAKVKNPYTPFKDKDFARDAQKKGAAKRRANKSAQEPHKA